MTKRVNQDNEKQKNNDIHLSRTQVFLSVIGIIVSITFSAYSLGISSSANSIAEEANDLSKLTLIHQLFIEESDLQIGVVQRGSNYFNEPTIRLPLINSYYARYPTLIVSIQGSLNEEKIEFYKYSYLETNKTIYPKNFRFVERDNPSFIEIVFTEQFNFTVSENDIINTIKLGTQKENLKKDNNLVLEIHYFDFSNMTTWTINPEIQFAYRNGEIIDIDLLNIEKQKIKQIEQN